ncbi:MAG: Gfo/Idh/MocA family oxidoreductase [Phycisphaeraceae bacterium]|nr:Gfo/Idh/MocA family oxidoreductase [Phycisphaeraceae bacterium]
MATLTTSGDPQQTIADRPRRRYAIVGLGCRAGMFIEPLATDHHEHAEIVAFCDPNPAAIAAHQRKLTQQGLPETPRFIASDPTEMVRRTRPDTVILCTPDHLHAPQAVRLMELGCDVIVEKPLAIDAAGCRDVLEATARTGRRVRVTFNCRYMPWAGLIHKLLRQGVIGDVISAQIDWMLDARKGVTYFSRWHAEKNRSGGLLVHKATHHLDLMNWWLDAVPRTVFAMGDRAFFGAENKHKHGIGRHGPVGDHYVGQDNSGDPFAPQPHTLGEARGRFDCTPGSPGSPGYRPDRSVWRGHDLDIEDVMSVMVRYHTGPILTYNLHAFGPRPQAMIAFNGTRGRLEFHQQPGGRVMPNGPVTTAVMPEDGVPAMWRTRCVVHPLFAQAWEVPVPVAEGDHDGGDPLLAMSLFAGMDDPSLGRAAGAQQAAASALIGIAGNLSLDTGQPVDMGQLCPHISHAFRLHELD